MRWQDTREQWQAVSSRLKWPESTAALLRTHRASVACRGPTLGARRGTSKAPPRILSTTSHNGTSSRRLATKNSKLADCAALTALLSPSMTHLLPPNLLRLFVPRPPLSYSPALPGDRDVVNRTTRQQRSRAPLDGVAAFLEKVKQDAADKGEATEGAEGDEEWTDAQCVRSEKKREGKKKAHEEYRKEAEAKCGITAARK